MKLLLVRHGETQWNVLGKIQGSSDVELNQKGLLQAKEIAEAFDLDSDYLIYSSARKRAYQTAQEISKRLNKEIKILEGLNEISLGMWEGMTWDEVAKIYSEDFIFWKNNRDFAKPHGGESYNELLERVLYSLKEIIENSNQDAIVTTHSLVIMIVCCFFDGESFSNILKYLPKNCEIIEFNQEDLLAKINKYFKNKSSLM